VIAFAAQKCVYYFSIVTSLFTGRRLEDNDKDMEESMNDESKPQETEQPFNQVIAARMAKLKQVKAMGINPFPYRFQRDSNTRQALDDFDRLVEKQAVLSMAGRIMTVRVMGKAAFFHFQDEFGPLQGYVKKDIIGEQLWTLFGLLDIGDIVGLTGTLFTTRTGEKTLNVSRFELLTKSLHPLPEKYHGLTDKEARYRQRCRLDRQSRSPRNVQASVKDHLGHPGFFEPGRIHGGGDTDSPAAVWRRVGRAIHHQT
jgi:lysyl-tRNA synthetase class II